jgi:photosystem II stability/assembly factor-like uncharacterized protein
MRHRIASCTVSILVVLFASPPAAVAQATPEQILDAFRWRNIGPANMGGRIVDIESFDDDFTTVYMATGSGGVWKSESAGTTWVPIFDDYPVVSVGDIAVFQPDPDIVWVGTGEANNRNSVSWGNGVYRSDDGGETFRHLGLEDTHQIARVVTHPTDPDVAYVAAIGHLWGYSGDRGLYRTADGGESWEKLTRGLPDDGRTGATDLVMDPTNPDVLYVAFYERIRMPWRFLSGGPNGGIFKSTDGGRSWRKLENGLPEGDTGRIGLAIYRQNPEIVMALVEAEQTNDLSRPGSGVYRSENGGERWTYVNTYNNRPFYYSQIRINPLDDQRVYLLTTRFMVSEDGGASFRNGSEDEEIHGDFHAMWLDPNNTDRYYIGQDKGAFITHDHGESFLFFDNIAIGQYYRIGVDMRDPYYVYGGLQDNGTYGGPSFSRDVRGILSDSNWKLHWGDGQDIQVDPTDWRTLYTESENGSFRRYDVETREFSGSSPSPNNILNYEAMVPAEDRQGGEEFRFNWSAPLVMSPHDPETLFLGGNHVFKTTDKGETWSIVSPDLSNDDPEKVEGESGGLTPDNSGAETHGSTTSISQSPIDPDVIWAGTDDGNVQITRDGGATWTNLRPNVPGVPDGIWLGRLEASHFDAARAYIVFDGHRSDVFTPWIFRTDDYGESWANITGNIPDGQVIHVVREDDRNPDLLFVGTEFAVFVSLDGGKRWDRLMNDMPTVATQDLVIHPRDADLVAGTHGRSIWILDDITPLQQLTPAVLASDGHLFEQRDATLWKNTSRGGQRGHHWFAGENPPTIEVTSSVPRAEFTTTALVTYYIGTEADDATLSISDPARRNTRTVAVATTPGIHRFAWDRNFDPTPLTDTQRTQVEHVFERALEILPGFYANRLRAAQSRFLNATDAREEREAAAVLLDPRLDSGLGEEFRMPSAEAGTYMLELNVDGTVYTGTLTIREDPITEKN